MSDLYIILRNTGYRNGDGLLKYEQSGDAGDLQDAMWVAEYMHGTDDTRWSDDIEWVQDACTLAVISHGGNFVYVLLDNDA